MEYDAELKDYCYHEGCVVGYVSGDKKGRFPDGTLIRTSTVLTQYSDLVFTRNSIYKLT